MDIGPVTVRGPMPKPETKRAVYRAPRWPPENAAMSWPAIQMAIYRRSDHSRPMRSLMKNDKPAPMPAVKYTKEMKLDIWATLEPYVMPNECWKPGSDGTIDEEP